MSEARAVSSALVWVALFATLLPCSLAAQYQGGLDGAAVIGERGTYGGLLGADLQLPLCEQPRECGFALGGAMQVGLAGSEQSSDSRVWLAIGPTFSLQGLATPAWEVAADVGVWVGARDESLDAGYHLGLRGFFGFPLSDSVAFGLHAGVSIYGGAQNWAVFQPGLALRWHDWEVS